VRGGEQQDAASLRLRRGGLLLRLDMVSPSLAGRRA
jgi:hypothetical protein